MMRSAHNGGFASVGRLFLRRVRSCTRSGFSRPLTCAGGLLREGAECGRAVERSPRDSRNQGSTSEASKTYSRGVAQVNGGIP